VSDRSRSNVWAAVSGTTAGEAWLRRTNQSRPSCWPGIRTPSRRWSAVCRSHTPLVEWVSARST